MRLTVWCFFAVGGLAFARSVVVLEVFWSATLGLSVCYFLLSVVWPLLGRLSFWKFFGLQP